MKPSTSDLSLIVRLPNWVGDVVMAVPTLQALAGLGLNIQLVGKRWSGDLLAGMNMPICSLEDGLWKTSKKLAGMTEHKKALLLTNSFSSALMMRIAGKAVIGYKTDGRQFLLTNGLSKPTEQRHEVHYFWSIARHACQYWFPELPWASESPAKLSLPLHQAFVTKADQLLSDHKITKPFWVLCPFAHGTGKNGESKVWPHWRALSRQLPHHQLLVCPGKNEEALCTELVPEAVMLPGLNLGEYAAVLAKADRVIANDSGPMHIAAAVSTTTLGIFGVSDPVRTHPWGADFIGKQGEWPSLEEVLARLQ